MDTRKKLFTDGGFHIEFTNIKDKLKLLFDIPDFFFDIIDINSYELVLVDDVANLDMESLDTSSNYIVFLFLNNNIDNSFIDALPHYQNLLDRVVSLLFCCDLIFDNQNLNSWHLLVKFVNLFNLKFLMIKNLNFISKLCETLNDLYKLYVKNNYLYIDCLKYSNEPNFFFISILENALLNSSNLLINNLSINDQTQVSKKLTLDDIRVLNDDLKNLSEFVNNRIYYFYYFFYYKNPAGFIYKYLKNKIEPNSILIKLDVDLIDFYKNDLIYKKYKTEIINLHVSNLKDFFKKLLKDGEKANEKTTISFNKLISRTKKLIINDAIFLDSFLNQFEISNIHFLWLSYFENAKNLNILDQWLSAHRDSLVVELNDVKDIDIFGGNNNLYNLTNLVLKFNTKINFTNDSNFFHNLLEKLFHCNFHKQSLIVEQCSITEDLHRKILSNNLCMSIFTSNDKLIITKKYPKIEIHNTLYDISDYKKQFANDVLFHLIENADKDGNNKKIFFYLFIRGVIPYAPENKMNFFLSVIKEIVSLNNKNDILTINSTCQVENVMPFFRKLKEIYFNLQDDSLINTLDDKNLKNIYNKIYTMRSNFLDQEITIELRAKLIHYYFSVELTTDSVDFMLYRCLFQINDFKTFYMQTVNSLFYFVFIEKAGALVDSIIDFFTSDLVIQALKNDLKSFGMFFSCFYLDSMHAIDFKKTRRYQQLNILLKDGRMENMKVDIMLTLFNQMLFISRKLSKKISKKSKENMLTLFWHMMFASGLDLSDIAFYTFINLDEKDHNYLKSNVLQENKFKAFLR